ncbi:unnamed protein product, partial [Phaeothamnion confervicola]
RARPADPFVDALRDLAWLPVLGASPSGAPWTRPASAPPVAAPAATRPLMDEWICSAALALSAEAVGSSTLSRVFGWNAPVPAAAAAQQLVALAERYEALSRDRDGHRRTAVERNITPNVAKIYEILDGALDSEDFTVVCRILEPYGYPIWVGERFVMAKHMAFDASVDGKPWLWPVPGNLHSFGDLLRAFGVREQFGPADFVRLLNGAAATTAAPLDERQLDMAVATLRLLVRQLRAAPADNSVRNATIFVPSESGVLMPARELVMDDAAWLRGRDADSSRAQYNIAHKDLGDATAEMLGVGSLRKLLLERQSAMQTIECPPVAALRAYLSPGRPAATAATTTAATTECLVLAEEAGARRVTVLLDAREYGRESVLTPGLGAAQGPALVVLLDGVVLSTDDIFGGFVRSFGFPPLGNGLCGLFHVTDCLSVLSGNQLHLFDPTGRHLYLPSAGAAGDGGSGSAAGAADPALEGGAAQSLPEARRCNISVNDIRDRFPHQYAPFLAIPAIGAAAGVAHALSSCGRCDATVLRLPLRQQKGPLSDLIWTVEAAEGALRGFFESARGAFVFGATLQEVSAFAMRDGARVAQLLFSCALAAGGGLVDRNRRTLMAADKEWKRSGLTTLLRRFVAPRVSYLLEVRTQVDEGGTAGHRTSIREWTDQWLVSSVLAPPAARETATGERYRTLELVPLLTCAAHVNRSSGDGSVRRPPATKGRLYVVQDSGIATGLPFHLDGPFFLRPSGSAGRRALQIGGSSGGGGGGGYGSAGPSPGEWNQIMYRAAMINLVPTFLMDLRGHFQGRDAQQLYRYWPANKRLRPCVSGMTPLDVYQKLGALPLFLSAGGGFRAMGEGLFKSGPISALVQEFVERRLSLFQVPHTVTGDLMTSSVPINELTPEQIRRFLHGRRMLADELSKPRLPLEVLAFCLSDCPPPTPGAPLPPGRRPVASRWAELVGLPLLPLANGGVGTFGAGTPFVLATRRQQRLFPSLAHRFVSIETLDRLAPWFADDNFLRALNIVRFGARAVALGVAETLPRSWRGASIVPWRSPSEMLPGSATAEPTMAPAAWLAALWQEVAALDTGVMEALKSWPLVPLTTGELMSCGKWGETVRMCPSMADTALAAALTDLLAEDERRHREQAAVE